jgi:hypothetical protein
MTNQNYMRLSQDFWCHSSKILYSGDLLGLRHQDEGERQCVIAFIYIYKAVRYISWEHYIASRTDSVGYYNCVQINKTLTN